MVEIEFKVGDICRVREWDEMLKLDGSTGVDGRIHLPNKAVCFIKEMRHLCGQTFTIREVTDYNGVSRYYSLEGIEWKDDGGRWIITPDMLELAIPESTDEDLDFEFDLSELLE